jgi:2-dehydro-3-deoxyphosphogluconate aldolase / (4S)-4-hydroxy-2-oxoglutarate aldolase
MPSSTLLSIAEQCVIPVLRNASPEDAVATAHACARAGMSVVELTCTTPGVEDAISTLRDDGMIVGLGTITGIDRIGPAVRAGASFVVSYCAPDGFVACAHDHDVVAIPGAFTPSEVEACRLDDADAVKLFPAERLSPAYLGQLLAVMPDLRLMATGGIGPSAESIRPWLAAGALAVGLGGALGTAANDGEAEVQLRARQAVQGCGHTS